MATVEAVILAYAPGTHVSKAHLLEENRHRATCCLSTSFLGAVTTQIIVIFYQNRGVLCKGCLFLSENIKVSHENAHVRARTQAQMEVMEQNSMCALKKMSMKHKQAISIKLKCDTCRTKTPISFVPEFCWFHVVTATEAAV